MRFSRLLHDSRTCCWRMKTQRGGGAPPDYFHKNIGITYGRLRTGDHHCKMIKHFAMYLALTKETEEETREVQSL